MRSWTIRAWSLGAALLIGGALACGGGTPGCGQSNQTTSTAPIQQGDQCGPNTTPKDMGPIAGDANQSHKIVCMPN